MKEAKINHSFLAKSKGWWKITVRDYSTNELIYQDRLFLGMPCDTTKPMRMDMILQKIGMKIKKLGYIA